ncbi:MAG TPA: hypothetical protein VKS60_15295 [Stellaceae bacterium]|nr:hypothetical protein [Stellaceae bacterium]
MRVPALLTVNPELQRNLWLELSATRLVAMPVALAVLLGGAYAIADAETAVSATRFVLAALLLFWGSRLAADGFGEEVTTRTWDNQRLSAASAWSMTLGKLAGGTSYVWYGALFCALALAAFGAPDVPALLAANLVAGLVAQGTALLTALVLHQFSPGSRRGQTTIAQLAGFVCGLSALQSVAIPTARTVATASVATTTWYGVNWDNNGFVLVNLVLLALWLGLGVGRSIRREFGHADGPLGWTLFTLYAVLFMLGFTPEQSVESRIAGWFATAALTAGVLTYGGLLVTPASPIGLKRLVAAAQAGRGLDAWRSLPMWVPSAAATVIGVVGFVATLFLTAASKPEPLLPVAALGFLVRDIAIVYLVRLVWKRRTLIALVILFGLLYGILPALFRASELSLVRELFLPIPQHWSPGQPSGVGFGAILPWLEAAAVLAALWRRLQPRPSPP